MELVVFKVNNTYVKNIDLQDYVKIHRILH